MFLNLSGIKGLASMAGILLLVSGCSTPAPESKPEFDQAELVEYETCLNTYVGDGSLVSGLTTRELMTFAMKACEDLRPVKK